MKPLVLGDFLNALADHS